MLLGKHAVYRSHETVAAESWERQLCPSQRSLLFSSVAELMRHGQIHVSLIPVINGEMKTKPTR